MAGELVERLRDQNYAGPMQHLRSWSEIDELFNAAAQRIEDVEADYLRRHNDACDRFEQVIELEARFEALERENATLRTERDEARKAKEAEHQQFLQMGSKYVQKCFDLAKVREAVIEEAAQISDNYLPSTFDAKAIAAAIRNMGGGENE